MIIPGIKRLFGLADNNPHRGPDWHEELAHDSNYYTAFWAAYKGYVKGALGGLILGTLLGGPIGLGAAFAAALASGSTIAFSAIATQFALAFGTYGMFMGFHEGSTIGANAGVGVALDELEVRTNRAIDKSANKTLKAMAMLVGKDKDLPAIKAAVDAEADAITPAKQYSTSPHVDSATAPTTTLFHGKVALFGIVLGVIAAALLCATATAFAPSLLAGVASHGLLTTLGTAVTHGGLAGMATASGALMAGKAAIFTAFGLFGASFGIDRIVFRRILDFTDKLFDGRVIPKNLVARSHSHKRQATQEISPVPAIPMPTLPPGTDLAAKGPEIEEKLRQAWGNKIQAEQLLKSFDHTRASMQ